MATIQEMREAVIDYEVRWLSDGANLHEIGALVRDGLVGVNDWTDAEVMQKYKEDIVREGNE